MTISRSALDAIAAAAAAAHPFEACGLLLGRGAHVAAATRAANVAADAAARFEIDPAHLVAAHRAARAGGAAILGYWHSHPSGHAQPSATDAAMAEPDGLIWAIAAAGAVACFRAVPAGALRGRFDAVDWRPVPD